MLGKTKQNDVPLLFSVVGSAATHLMLGFHLLQLSDQGIQVFSAISGSLLESEVLDSSSRAPDPVIKQNPMGSGDFPEYLTDSGVPVVHQHHPPFGCYYVPAADTGLAPLLIGQRNSLW